MPWPKISAKRKTQKSAHILFAKGEELPGNSAALLNRYLSDTRGSMLFFSHHGYTRSIILSIIAILFFSQSVLAAEPVEVGVEGIEGEALENVRKALVLPPGMVSEGKADRLWLERFELQAIEKARKALEPYGYYNSRISASIEDLEKDRYRLLVRVEPGEPVTLSEVKVELRGSGAGQKPLKELVAAFPLHKGDILLQQRYEETKGLFISKARSLGYLDADFTTHEIRITPGKTSARIELLMETGEQYRFGETRLEGAPDYPEKFLRRYLAFQPEEIYSPTKLGETQLNFSNSERFKEVVISPEKESAADLRVPVLVRLKPGPSKTLRLGLGYGTDTGARISTRYRALNVFRLGHDLNINLYVAQRLQGLSAGYIIPSASNIKSSTGVQLNLQRQDVTTYVSRLISLELDRNLAFDPGQVGTAFIRLQQEDFVIGAQHSGDRLVLPGIRFTESRYDNQIRPTHGYRYEVEVRGTHQMLGSDSGLLQAVADGSTLIPLPWSFSLHTRAKVGLTLLSDPLKDLPVSLRFFAGGDQSVRGYSYQALGPVDSTGAVVGGKHLMVGSMELERPVYKNWTASLFYDVGNAFNTFNSVKLFQGAGVGVHYYSPIGALNLYLARQLGVDNPAWRIHFTVGFEM